MPLRRRIADAFSDLPRAWALGRGVARLAIRGELATAWTRLRPSGFGTSDYRRWISSVECALPPPVTLQRVSWLVLVEAAGIADDVVGEVVASIAAPDGASAVVSLRVGGAQWTMAVPPARARQAWDFPTRGGIDGVLEQSHAEAPRWIVWICQPALLATHALAALAESASSDSSLVYADSDWADPTGQRSRPTFRPAWDIELARTDDGSGPLIAFPLSLATGNGAVRTALDRADHLALLLAAAAQVDPATIVHVPRVLSHRVGTAVDASEGDLPGSSPGPVGGISPRPDAVVSAHSVAPPLVSLVIPSRDRPDLVAACIQSILERSTYGRYELVFVDNDSTDPRMLELYRKALESRPGCIVRVAGGFNFPRLCNAGAAAAAGDVLVMLNNDTKVLTPHWLEELVDIVGERDVGAAGPLLLYEGGRIQHAGILLGVNGTADNALANFDRADPIARAWCRSRRTVSAVLGACLAVRSDAYRLAGGMDEAFAVSHNEIDLCLRLAARGMRTVFSPHAVLAHAESATRGYDLTPAQRATRDAERDLFARRWAGRLEVCDPSYHPALTRTGSQFRLSSQVFGCEPRRRRVGSSGSANPTTPTSRTTPTSWHSATP